MATQTDRAKIEKLLSVGRATRPLPAPDGSLYFASNRDGHAQVYRQAGPGATPEHVFASQTRMVPHAFTPAGLLVREDRGGNETWQLGLLALNQPTIQGYDEKAFAALAKDRPIGPSLEAMRWARESTSQLLERMTDEDWHRVGTHTESGRYGAEDWLRIYALHGHDHADQIKRARGTS